MNPRQELIEGIKSQTKKIVYKFPNGRKFTFLIKPFLVKDFMTNDILSEAMKEIATGQKLEDAARIASEKFLNLLNGSTRDRTIKNIIIKLVEYPKIVDKEEGLKDDEIPYSVLDLSMKSFILEKIIEISPR